MVTKGNSPHSKHHFTITLKKGNTNYIGTFSYGEETILREDDSDVVLSIPKGLHCAVVGHVHTYTQDILKLIPSGECLIAPVPEYSCLVNKRARLESMFQTKLRHCVINNWNNIIVRHGDFRKGVPFTRMKKVSVLWLAEHGLRSLDLHGEYTVDKEFNTIYTSNFCQFLCTLCGEQCKGEIQALLFGSPFMSN